MYLSRLYPNVNNRRARKDLGSPSELHSTLWNAFPNLRKDEKGEFLDRILFRLDADPPRGRPVIIVQSSIPTDWRYLLELDAKYLNQPPEIKEIGPVFHKGQRLNFRLRAAPTRKVDKPDRPENVKNFGRRIAILDEGAQLDWLLRHGDPAQYSPAVRVEDRPPGGFRIPGEWIAVPNPATDTESRLPNFAVKVMPEGWVWRNRSRSDKTRYLAVRFEGLLEVTDPILFLETLQRGIGPAKGFGFGLLSVARA